MEEGPCSDERYRKVKYFRQTCLLVNKLSVESHAHLILEQHKENAGHNGRQLAAQHLHITQKNSKFVFYCMPCGEDGNKNLSWGANIVHNQTIPSGGN